MEKKSNSINHGTEGSAITREETETSLDEFLEHELKDDSMGRLRVGNVAELALNYVESNSQESILYIEKENADTDNILDREFDALSNDEDTGSDAHKLIHEECTTFEVPQVMSTISSTSVVAGDMIKEKVIGITRDVIDGGGDECAEIKKKIVGVHHKEVSIELTYNKKENGEGKENEFKNTELSDAQKARQKISKNEENSEIANIQEGIEEILENEENCEFTQEVNIKSDMRENQLKEIAENELENEENDNKSLENEEKISVIVENETVKEREEYYGYSENKLESEKVLGGEGKKKNIKNANGNVVDTEYEELSGNQDECITDSDKLETLIVNASETKIGSKVQVSDEINFHSEISPDDSAELKKDTEKTVEKQGASVGPSLQPNAKNVIYVMVQTKESYNKNRDDMDDNLSSIETIEAQCNNNLTKIKSDGTDKQPAGNAVLTMDNNSESKTIINKAIIIKTIKTKLPKTLTNVVSSEVSSTAAAADTTIDVNNKHNNKDKQQNVEDSEIKETKENNCNSSNNDIKNKSDIGKETSAIQTKMCQNRIRKEEKRDRNIMKVNTEKKESKGKKMNGIQKKIVKHTAMNKHALDKTITVAAAGGNKSDENEKKIQLVAVKRKLEEMFQVSQEEDELMIDEIKKMKKETLDILTKITSEVEKIVAFFGESVK